MKFLVLMQLEIMQVIKCDFGLTTAAIINAWQLKTTSTILDENIFIAALWISILQDRYPVCGALRIEEPVLCLIEASTLRGNFYKSIDLFIKLPQYVFLVHAFSSALEVILFS